mgnify:CR=1 FL=1
MSDKDQQPRGHRPTGFTRRSRRLENEQSQSEARRERPLQSRAETEEPQAHYTRTPPPGGTLKATQHPRSTGFTRRSRLAGTIPTPEPQPYQHQSRPDPISVQQNAPSAKAMTANPFFKFGVGLLYVVVIGFFLKTCVVALMPPADPLDDEPEVAKQYYRSLGYAASASKLCDVMHETQLVTSCSPDRENRIVRVAIPTNDSALICYGSVAMLQERTTEFIGSGWRLQINDVVCPLG